MNHLWVRLSLAFSLVIVISFLSVVMVIRLTVEVVSERLSITQEIEAGLQTSLAAYYHTYQSWDDIAPILTIIQDTFSNTPLNNLRLILTDGDGRIIFGTPDVEDSTTLDHPIISDDRIVGYVSANMPRNFIMRQPPEIPLLSQFLLFTAVAGSVAGALIGTLMSRSLTAPLANLAAAAVALGAKDWQQRVEIKGTSEVVKLARAFNQMAVALETNERLRRNLIADVAHELRTPLVTLQGNLYAILDDVYPLTKHEIANLYDQSRLLSRLIEDLQELSLAEANQLPMTQSPTDLSYLIERAVTTFQPVAASKNIDIHAQFPDAPAIVMADPARITQVLQNLLNNALTHSPDHSEISISLSDKNSHLVLSIKDSGEGIPPEHQPYIFERFYRVDKARSRTTGGAGLGLAIAKAIVEAHDGRIGVTSTGITGDGTTFTICLPAANLVKQ